MEVFFGKILIYKYNNPLTVDELGSTINQDLGLSSKQFYLLSNGRRVTTGHVSETVHIVPRILGGKGGFGSMLRAIGAQIEKTTNREACRDLSGRRLRDINEEQRLKKWVAQQADREKEAKEKKKKKLEKLLEQPKHEFKDEEYDKERSVLPEKVEDAVLQGLEASCSTSKRKIEDSKNKIPKKKPKLWVDSDEDFLSSGSDSEDNSKPGASDLKIESEITTPSEKDNKIAE
ncbi:unnamed protein product [Ceutorhynchus assimilis]|uniref:SDE2-like domain-containing protein n=1 Tax=Ceutorhynchus assimilis TaxID=467358 RepID=A0A9N9MEC7_9CUCU|nr:unnamed protein product [Ceutorhynchus assimilis]